MARGLENKENQSMNTVTEGKGSQNPTTVYMGYPEWKAQSFAPVEVILAKMFTTLGQSYDKFVRQTEIAD